MQILLNLAVIIFFLACDHDKNLSHKQNTVKTSSTTIADGKVSDIPSNIHIQLLAFPEHYTKVSTVTFSFSANTNNEVQFLCTLDNESRTCVSPFSVFLKNEGEYIFTVSGSYKILEHEVFLDSVSYRFVIDHTPPAIIQTEANGFYPLDPIDPTHAKPLQPTITFNEPVKEIKCAIQGEHDTIDGMIFSNCDDILQSAKDDAGAYLVYAKATDLAGNTMNSMIVDGFVYNDDNDNNKNQVAKVNISTNTSTASDGYVYHAPQIFQQFYKNYSDDFDILFMFTTFDVTQSFGFASSLPLKTNIDGIGYENYADTKLIQKAGGNISKQYGSEGWLEHVIKLNTLSRYPDNPWDRFTAPNGYVFTSPLWILAHELGHRWGIYIKYPDEHGEPSDILLDATKTHFQFFMNSGGSPLEGNTIRESSPAHFFTLTPKHPGFFGTLELYLMGFISSDMVENTFVILNPNIDADIHAKGELYFTGKKLMIDIDTVMQTNGKRFPSYKLSPKHFRGGFILFETDEFQASDEMIQKVERYRKAFQSYWFFVTKGYSTLETRLSL